MVASRTKVALVKSEDYWFGAAPVIALHDYINAVNASADMGEAQGSVRETYEQYGNLIGAGGLVDTNTQQNFLVEQGMSITSASLGQGSTRTTIQAACRALGTVDSIDLSSNTVIDSQLGTLTVAVVAPSAGLDPTTA